MRTSTATLSALVALLVLAPDLQAQQGPAPVNLGLAGTYAILAKTGITTVPASVITGDVGISPAASTDITGFNLTNATGYATSPQVSGRVYAADMASPTPLNVALAVGSMEAAYTDAAARPNPDFIELGTGNIGGLALVPGLYKWGGTVLAPSNFSLAGGPNDVWILQIAGDLTVSSNVIVTLTGGARAQNIFWQVAGVVAIGTSAHFEGIILGKTGISMMNGASLNGRTLAQTAVTMDMNTVNTATLPVELVSFSGTVSGATAQLTWTTESETNNAGFTIEAQAGPPGRAASWQDIAFVAGRGTVVERTTYTHAVGGLAAGTYTFRLRQMDLDGAVSYSPAVEVSVGLDEAATVEVRGRSVRFAVREGQAVRAELFNALGQRLATLYDADVPAGATQTLSLPTGLSAGVYLVRLTGRAFSETATVVVR